MPDQGLGYEGLEYLLGFWCLGRLENQGLRY